MPRWTGEQAVDATIEKLELGQALKLPCANGPCKNPAVHVVSGNFDYPEKVKARRTEEGFRWVTRTESFLLNLCPDHRDKWLRKTTTVTVGGGLI